MPISDAFLDVICDECGNEERVELPYTYQNYSGTSGQYDYEQAVAGLEVKGWQIDNGDVPSCPECHDEDADAATGDTDGD